MIGVDQWIIRMNIRHFRKRLAEETDEAKRRTIARLLAEEEEKLQFAEEPGSDGVNQEDD